MAENKDSITFRGDKGVSNQRMEYVGNGKNIDVVERVESDSSSLSHDEKVHVKPPTTARELVTEILLVEDDPSLNPYTFRMWFIGVGISVFAG
jgi:hypothetical protein